MAGRDELHTAQHVVQWAQEHGEVGGVLTSHSQLTARLRSAGHRVTYVDTGSPFRALGALPRILGGPALHLFHITRLWRAIVLAPAFALLPGRTVLVLHSGSFGRQLDRMGRAQARLLQASLHAYDEVWAVNEGIGSRLPAALSARVRVVAPFCGAPDPTDAEGGTRDPHLLSVATNAGLPHYRADLAVKAVELVREEWPDARLRILAYGHDGEHLAALRRRVADVPWVDMTFNAGPEEVHRVLRESAIFLRPTDWDGDSVVVREALAAGARVVATDTSPRPAGVELSPLDAASLARVVLHGGPVSTGAGLASVGMDDAAAAALRTLERRRR